MRRPEICWKKKIGGTFGGLCPLVGCICFFTDFVRRRNSTTQIVYLTSAEKKIGGTFGGLCPLIACIFFFGLCFFCFSAELHYTNYAPDICWFFFRRNSTSQNVRLSSADLYGFSAEVHKFSNRASLQHFLSLACYWPSCNGCNGRGLEWAWISGHWIQSMPRLIDGL